MKEWIERNQISYDAISAVWAEYRAGRPVGQHIMRFAKLLPCGGRVLDLGCGAGGPAVFLAEQGLQVTGVDNATNMIAYCRRRELPNAVFLCEEIQEFVETAKECWNGILAFDSLWHLPQQALPRVYAKLPQRLEPGGYLLFTAGKRQGLAEGEMFEHHFTYSSLDSAHTVEILRQNGMEIIECLEDYADADIGSRDLLILARKNT